MEKKVNNLLSFNDFEKSWKAKEPKKTKRTDVGLDIIEEKKGELEDDDLIDDEVIEDEIVDDEPLEEIEDSEDDTSEDQDWQEQLKSLIDSIIEDGEEAEEVFDYIKELQSEYGDEGEEVVDADDIDADDLDDEEGEVEMIADDDEGEGLGESVKSFKNWKK